jgi:hypothetical protein
MEMSAAEEKNYEALYRIRVSVRYHQRRARWFESLDLWVKGISVLMGTAAVAALWKDHEDVAAWAAALITVGTTLSLVFGFSQKARLHSDFVRRYLELESELVSKIEPDLPYIHGVNGRIRMLEGQEPAPLGALVTLCQNELARQDGQEAYVVPMRWYHRLFAHLIDFPLQSRI